MYIDMYIMTYTMSLSLSIYIYGQTPPRTYICLTSHSTQHSTYYSQCQIISASNPSASHSTHETNDHPYLHHLHLIHIQLIKQNDYPYLHHSFLRENLRNLKNLKNLLSRGLGVALDRKGCPPDYRKVCFFRLFRFPSRKPKKPKKPIFQESWEWSLLSKASSRLLESRFFRFSRRKPEKP